MWLLQEGPEALMYEKFHDQRKGITVGLAKKEQGYSLGENGQEERETMHSCSSFSTVIGELVYIMLY